MRELNYGCQLERTFVIITPLLGCNSVYIHLDQVLAEIETKVGSLTGKRIICEGQDGYWDLILPAGKEELTGTKIYPLNAINLAQAKVKIRELIDRGKI